MEGCLKSKSKGWRHIFKMSVRPGGEIPLDTLYDMYGAKYKIAEKDFIGWLKEVKLKGRQDDWLIIEKDSKYVSNASTKEIKKDNTEYVANGNGDVVARKMTVEDVVALPVRKAREVVPTIMDIKLIKYAIAEARPRANKDSLILILEKRLRELQQV